MGSLTRCLTIDVALLGVGAERRGVGDAVAGLEILDALADGDDLAGPFVAGREGPRRRRIEAGAIIDVEIIDADRVMAHARFPGPGRRDLDILQAHDVGRPGLVDANRAHGSSPARIRAMIVPAKRRAQAALPRKSVAKPRFPRFGGRFASSVARGRRQRNRRQSTRFAAALPARRGVLIASAVPAEPERKASAHRLAVQDVALSRRKQGFDSPWARQANQRFS